MDFILYVLVPEAAILLIMSDQGWEGPLDPLDSTWVEPRKKAFHTWRGSIDFGARRFAEGSETAQRIFRTLEGQQASVRATCEKAWAKAPAVDEPSQPCDPSSAPMPTGI